MSGPAPIGAAEAEFLFAPFAAHEAVLLAVSGGVDSVAMMLLAARWRASGPTGPKLFVATVDHGLRPESGMEAATVAGWAREASLPHATLVWNHRQAGRVSQESARAARYGLLREHARTIGADALATAHHADDQAETVLMRLVRGSGPAGLAGMRQGGTLDGLTLLRPLLNVPKVRLAATLARAGHPFCEDPSNEKPLYARNRIRRLWALLEPEGLTRERLTTLAARAARAEQALSAAADKAFAGLASQAGGGLALAASLFDEPAEIRLRLLARAVVEARGGGEAPRLERLEALEAAVAEAAAERRSLRRTLGGCMVTLGRNGTVTVTQEKPRRRGANRQS
ncbi:tRNA(Ile)-lysidine synthase [Alsobacter metallidurans]|uniref:tRNA(Ile)-lysidine synthase n=1 Tax=Alsobacter metallidurans TaxID=340221 RepID=A0A917MJZ7_9HYPH|nr:tRNA lysidine(34) synthetase TilS [Alsobacter metallidurans]GGH29696.1 tRNA(Ile)-lysidine synthase [Alsobacter metallidurans]